MRKYRTDDNDLVVLEHQPIDFDRNVDRKQSVR